MSQKTVKPYNSDKSKKEVIEEIIFNRNVVKHLFNLFFF